MRHFYIHPLDFSGMMQPMDIDLRRRSESARTMLMSAIYITARSWENEPVT